MIEPGVPQSEPWPQDDPAEDPALVAGFLGGDEGCFDRIVERYKRPLCRFARSYLGPAAHLAEDVVQETLVAAYRSLPSFEGRSSLKTWLYSVARNLCRGELRRRDARLRRAADAEGGPELLELPDVGPDPLLALQQEEVRRALEQAIEALPEMLRAALVLRDAEGLSYEEIAQVLEVPVGTVRSRLHNARARLAGCLAHYRDRGRAATAQEQERPSSPLSRDGLRTAPGRKP